MRTKGLVTVFGRGKDEEYVGVAPGIIPPADAASVRKVQSGTEWNGTVAVQFQPPQGVSAALAGTVLDGSVDPQDIGAMLIDLSLRGWFHIRKGDDGGWRFIQAPDFPHDSITDAEAGMLNALFPPGVTETDIDGFKHRFRGSVRAVVDGMYRETLERGWYREYPQRGKLATFFMGRVPRTADGTAVRVQTLGFRKYLETAEAKQIKHEERAGEFSRYLPYALVFGVAEHWAKVMGEIVQLAKLDAAAMGTTDVMGGLMLDPFFWLFADDFLELGVEGVGALADALSDGGLFDLASGLGDVLSDVGDVTGDLFDGVGDFFDF